MSNAYVRHVEKRIKEPHERMFKSNKTFALFDLQICKQGARSFHPQGQDMLSVIYNLRLWIRKVQKLCLKFYTDSQCRHMVEYKYLREHLRIRNQIYRIQSTLIKK